MNGSHKLVAGDKIMIRNGVFHSTTAVGDHLALLEVETPNDKNDLVRLEDNYGRSGKPYESIDQCVPKVACLSFEENTAKILSGFKYEVLKIDNKEELLNRKEGKIVVLEGRVYYQDWDICAPGDIVDSNTMTRFAGKFSATPMTILEITKHE